MVSQVARQRISELRSSGLQLVNAIDALLQSGSSTRRHSVPSARLAKTQPSRKGTSLRK
jgi:hypothetical protein